MLGGGTWESQNKVLPGMYINFVGLTRSNLSVAERGYVALPMELNWGDTITTIKVEEFEKNALKLTGYLYNDGQNKPLREIFRHAHTIYLGRTNGGGSKASCAYGTARYAGTRGNDLKMVITFDVDDSTKYDVISYLGDEKINTQIVSKSSELVDDEFIVYDKTVALAEIAGVDFSGGTNETVTISSHQAFIDKIETYSFNALVCDSDNDNVKTLYANFEKRMRDNMGVKFSTVLHSKTADYIGCINFITKATEGDTKLVYWIGGIEAGCAISKSCANKPYDGEYTPIIDLTQEELKQTIVDGKMTFHKVGQEIRILKDINSLTTTTETLTDDFKSNQTIRIIDQIGNDMATLFNNSYNAEVPNDADGRITLQKDIAKLYKEYLKQRAITDFDSEDIVVSKGDDKDAVVIDAPATIVNCMEKAYMRVVIA